MLHICGVSKTFGEWYQKTNKTEDTNKLTLLAYKNNHHPSQHMVGNVRKASGNCQQRPL
jgi:CobQ-like glutamine amidotransferase family enzyme